MRASIRRLLIAGSLALLTGGRTLFAAELSERKDIAVFGVTAYPSTGYNMPPETLHYVDRSINNVFINLKRFNVLGYGDYRMEMKDIEEFIARVRAARAQKAEEAGTYDEKFGTLVIKGEDFDRIANSFLVVVPTLSSYDVILEREPFDLGDYSIFKRIYNVGVVLDLTFVNVLEGTQEVSVRIAGAGRDESVERADKLAVDGAISSLGMKLRQIETFKIKSGVLLVRGDTVSFAHGGDIGVKPGDEFEVMTKQEVGDSGKFVELPTGLVKVKKAYPDSSEGQIIYQKERITEGDQLVEVAKLGLQLSFRGGVMRADIPQMDYEIRVIDDSLNPAEYFYMDLDQQDVQFAPIAGLTVEKSLGYRYKAIFDGTVLLNSPFFGFIGEFGAGTVLRKRRASLDLSALGGFIYMTSFAQELGSGGGADVLYINGVPIDYSNDPVMSISGFSAGFKGSAVFTFLIQPGFALNLGAGYRFYLPVESWNHHIEETSGGNETDVKGDSANILESASSGRVKQVSVSGLEATFGLMLRF